MLVLTVNRNLAIRRKREATLGRVSFDLVQVLGAEISGPVLAILG